MSALAGVEGVDEELEQTEVSKPCGRFICTVLLQKEEEKNELLFKALSDLFKCRITLLCKLLKL